GVGGAAPAPAALSLAATTFPEGPPRNRAMGVYAAMSVAGGGVGLLAGGLLTTYASWRSVLFVNVPIGLAVALAAPRVLAETPRRRGRFDLPGPLTGTGRGPPPGFRPPHPGSRPHRGPPPRAAYDGAPRAAADAAPG